MMERLFERLEAGAPWVGRAAGLAVLITAVVAGNIYGLGTGLLVAAGGVLLLAIALFWSSLQNLTGETGLSLEEALHLAAPTAEEEQKRAVLRALKDLEYERSVGKISEQDYRELSERYRGDAKRLIVALDSGLDGRRDRAERLVAKRLAAGAPALAKAAPGGATTLVSRGTPRETDSISSKKPSVKRVYAHDVSTQTLPSTTLEPAAEEASARRGPTRRCAPCGTRNDLDARFCKGCGISLLGPGERLCGACPSVYDAALEACPACGVAANAPEETS
jgi:hypothetical protein